MFKSATPVEPSRGSSNLVIPESDYELEKLEEVEEELPLSYRPTLYTSEEGNMCCQFGNSGLVIFGKEGGNSALEMHFTPEGATRFTEKTSVKYTLIFLSGLAHLRNLLTDEKGQQYNLLTRNLVGFTNKEFALFLKKVVGDSLVIEEKDYDLEEPSSFPKTLIYSDPVGNLLRKKRGSEQETVSMRMYRCTFGDLESLLNNSRIMRLAAKASSKVDGIKVKSPKYFNDKNLIRMGYTKVA